MTYAAGLSTHGTSMPSFALTVINNSLCSSPSPTTAHILNGCQEALTQGRYTWRHDSVLNCIIALMSDETPPQAKLYADLPGFRASESPPATLPTNLSTSTARPDIILISGDNVTILELTSPPTQRKQLTRPKRERVTRQTITPLLVTSKNEVYLSPTELLKLARLVIIYQMPSALSLTLFRLQNQKQNLYFLKPQR